MLTLLYAKSEKIPMKLFLMFIFVVLLLSGGAYGYYCIDNSDNSAVQEFKAKLNYLALKEDIQTNNLTEDQWKLKMRYFSPCR